MAHTDLTLLPLDHPGAQDPSYRARRDQIAAAARQFHLDGGAFPVISYTEEEHATWRVATSNLRHLHRQHACKLHREASERLQVDEHRIPALKDLSNRLMTLSGFRLEPIEGLVDSRSFLSRLADRTMLCTQYIRHHSRPDYTPEPDIIHEVIGHVPTFTDPDIVAFSEFIGRLARVADAQQLIELERLYWFSLEFGLIQEDGGIKIFGAGLLSSFGEMPHAYSDEVTRKPFSVAEVIKTPFDFSAMQNTLFVIPSFAELRQMTEAHFAPPLTKVTKKP